MPNRRKLTFSNLYELIAEVERLRGGYEQLGQWTLPQICYHLRYPIDQSLREPESTEPTAKQREYQGFLEQVNVSGWPDKVLDASEPMRPPADCNAAEVEAFLESLRRLQTYGADYVDAFIFGPVPTEKFKRFILAHAAHHLSFLAPTAPARRPALRFADEDAVIEELNRLRKGYAKAGSWSLPQIAWHLNQAVLARMKPGPHPADSPAQTAQKPMAQHVLSMNGYLPGGMSAPDPMVPPADAPASAIDDLIASLRQLKAFKGQIAPHRLFGHLSDADARRLNLVHCAHHLSYLAPAEN